MGTNDFSGVRRLYEIMKRLRAPGGCPWDREQTMQTLKPCLLEETYELLEAMEGDDLALHVEELGDVLLQVVFQCAIREEEGRFTLDDVAATLAEKLVRRHPHVFGDDDAGDANSSEGRWERIKAEDNREFLFVGRLSPEKGAEVAAEAASEAVVEEVPAEAQAEAATETPGEEKPAEEEVPFEDLFKVDSMKFDFTAVEETSEEEGNAAGGAKKKKGKKGKGGDEEE